MADLLLFSLVLFCTVSDLRTGRIPNLATYPAIIAGLAIGAFSGGPAFISRVEGFLLAMVLMGVLALAGGMGGGDAKLLAAVGALKGFPFILDALFYSFLAGGALALSVAIWQGRLIEVLGRVCRALFSVLVLRNGPGEAWEDTRSYRIPFGAAIAVGTVWAYLNLVIL